MGDVGSPGIRQSEHCFTSMVPPSEIFKDKTKIEYIELDVPQPPTIRVSTMVTVNLERGQTGECYQWTKEEALLIRNALNEALGDPPKPYTGIRGGGPAMGPDYRNGNLQS